jgi:hypothetical protein
LRPADGLCCRSKKRRAELVQWSKGNGEEINEISKHKQRRFIFENAVVLFLFWEECFVHLGESKWGMTDSFDARLKSTGKQNVIGRGAE